MTFSRESRREYVLSALEKHERQLARYAARLLGGNFDLAADIVQFTFMKLCDQNSKKPDSQLKAWLYTVCRNRIIDEVRKNSRVSSAEPNQMDIVNMRGSDPQQIAEDQEWIDSLRVRINQLPDADREIVDLWSHGLKHQEIAEITSKKPGTVRVQLHRVIQALKKEMGVDRFADSR